jgi:hypothetical protein
VVQQPGPGGPFGGEEAGGDGEARVGQFGGKLAWTRSTGERPRSGMRDALQGRPKRWRASRLGVSVLAITTSTSSMRRSPPPSAASVGPSARLRRSGGRVAPQCLRDRTGHGRRRRELADLVSLPSTLISCVFDRLTASQMLRRRPRRAGCRRGDLCGAQTDDDALPAFSVHCPYQSRAVLRHAAMGSSSVPNSSRAVTSR